MSRTLQLGISEETLNSKKLIEVFCQGAMTIPTEDVEAVVDWLIDQETLLPIFNPTAYIEYGDNIPSHLEVHQAFLTFRRVLDTVMKR